MVRHSNESRLTPYRASHCDPKQDDGGATTRVAGRPASARPPRRTATTRARDAEMPAGNERLNWLPTACPSWNAGLNIALT